MKSSFSSAWLLAVFFGFCASAACADSGAAQARFARVDNHNDGTPRALQLAVVRYAPSNAASDLTVDLISAVHIGDKSYYASLNERFRNYDSLLYELVVADPDSYETRPDNDRGILSSIQIKLKDSLGLAFQLDEIDYRAINFVHADLSAQMLFDSMEERGESLYVYFWRLFFAAIDEYAKDPLGLQDMRMMSRLVTAPDDDALKVMIAHEMVKATHTGDFLGSDDGSAVIAARNAHAIEVLKAEIESGAKRLGIFYGAAHMPDFDGRLTGELGLRRVSTEWTDAWRFATEAPTVD